MTDNKFYLKRIFKWPLLLVLQDKMTKREIYEHLDGLLQRCST